MRVPIAIGTALFLCGCGDPRPVQVSGVLFTLDTTNPGALDVYAEGHGLTPAIASLAAQGLVFERAHSVAPLTLPSHVSMMTGLYPLRHGVRDNGWSRLPGQAETLAERAREAGYQTAAFVSAVVLGAAYGLDQGFDHYSEPSEDPRGALSKIHELSAAETTERALAWLEERDRGTPFFLWVHYFDAHMPYLPPPEFVERAAGSLYRAEVAAVDHEVGRLMRALDEDCGREHLFVAIVADHGESFGRHGELTHSAFAYQATMHVPLLLRFPDGRRAGTRTEDVVSIVDIFPTFLRELDLGRARGQDGLALGADPIPVERGVYMESYAGYLNYGWSPLAGWLDREGKYLHSSRPEYYDLQSDPTESHNLLLEGERDVSSYIQALEALERRPALALDRSLQLDEEALQALRALGYAASGEAATRLPGPLAASTRPAPAERSEEYTRFAKALGLAQAGRNKRAIKMLNKIAQESPGNVYAIETLGGCLLQEQRFEETVELLRGLLQRGERRYTTSICLATALENLGRLSEALVQYKAAEVMRPTEPTLKQAIDRVKAKLAGERL